MVLTPFQLDTCSDATLATTPYSIPNTEPMCLSIIEFWAGHSQCLANSVMYELSALGGRVSMS